MSWCIVACSLVECVPRFGLIARIKRNILTNQRVNKVGNLGAGLIGSHSLNQVVKIDIGCIAILLDASYARGQFSSWILTPTQGCRLKPATYWYALEQLLLKEMNSCAVIF